MLNFFRDETGLEMSEYAIAAALVAATALISFIALGNGIVARIESMTATINA